MASITYQKMRKVYDDGTEAIPGMDLEVKDGEFLVFVGPSGCGKSTALRMTAGLEDISGGRLLIGDQVVNNKSPQERDIAMVFQDYALYPHMTVGQNMGFALKMMRIPKAEIRKRVEEAADRLSLDRPAGPQTQEPVRRPAATGRHGPGHRPRNRRRS